MMVRVLGSAAGGGIPQWNCACAGCLTARRSGVDRLQDTVAVSGNGADWYLLNASPDLRAQLVATPELAPGPGLRDTPLRGVVLSTAELDHTAGLLGLREAGRLTVYATGVVLVALSSAFPVRRLLDAYTEVSWQRLTEGQPCPLPGGLVVEALTVGQKRPRYARDLPGDVADDWVSALRVTDPRAGTVFVYATCLPVWTARFDAFVEGADVVLLDGTFGTDDELTRATGKAGSAAAMGHLPVADSAPHLARHPATTFWYGHLNNTNPLAHHDPRAVADGQVLTSG